MSTRTRISTKSLGTKASHKQPNNISPTQEKSQHASTAHHSHHQSYETNTAIQPGTLPTLLHLLAPQPVSTYRQFQSKLRSQYKITDSKDTSLLDDVKQLLSYNALLLTLTNTTQYTSKQLAVVDTYLQQGGRVLLCNSIGSEEADAKSGSNNDDNDKYSSSASSSSNQFDVCNKWLQQYGLALNKESVVSRMYRGEAGSYHPKEVLMDTPDTILTQSIRTALNYYRKTQDTATADHDDDDESPLNYIYPYGTTLTLHTESTDNNITTTPLLSTTTTAFPMQQCIVALSTLNSSSGVLLVVGSGKLFDDSYMNSSLQQHPDQHSMKVDNSQLTHILLHHLFEPESLNVHHPLNTLIDEEHPIYTPMVEPLPDIEALSENLRFCLQDTEELPADFSTLYDYKIHTYTTAAVPETLQLYEKLNVKHEPLGLIPPQFEVPFPPTQPAIFPPVLREFPTPALDLYDLDEHFAPPDVKLSQLTNKCVADSDAEYFIREAADTCGIVDEIRTAEDSNKPEQKTNDSDKKSATAVKQYSANHILSHMLHRLIEWKKIEQSSNYTYKADPTSTTDTIQFGSDAEGGEQQHHGNGTEAMTFD